MRLVFLFTVLLSSMAAFSQSSRYRVYSIPEVNFFVNLYADDYIGDVLKVDGKEDFFSQSPMKQFSGYMLGQNDPRLVLVSGKPLASQGKADKGYVVSFSIGKDGVAQVDGATYEGCIYPEDYNNKPMSLDMLFKNKGITKKDGVWKAEWLDGNYRVNTVQANAKDRSKNECCVAVFSKGKLVKIIADTEKASFNPPMIDLNEKPKGVSVHDFEPQTVYYNTDKGMVKESVVDTQKKWSDKLVSTFGKEPFLDIDCVKQLGRAWTKK